MALVSDVIAYLEAQAPHTSYSVSDAIDADGIEARCDTDHSGVGDCSGWLCNALRHFGVPLPKPCMVSGEMYQECANAGMLIRFQDAQPGDLLFRGFRGSDHVAMKINATQQIAAHGVHFTPQVGIANIGSAAEWTPMAGRIPGLSHVLPFPKPPVILELEMAGALVGNQPQQRGPFANRYPFIESKVQADGRTDLVGHNGAVISGGTDFLGMSVFPLGHLASPIMAVDVINSNTFVFLADDGGTFQVVAEPHYW